LVDFPFIGLRGREAGVNDGTRFAVFVGIVLGLWTGMHLFLLWRLWELPLMAGAGIRRWALLLAAVGWLSYPLGRLLVHSRSFPWAPAVELAGAIWMGVLFFAVVALLVVDLPTGFGRLLPAWSIHLRLAAVALALFLSAAALVQGLRAPCVRELELPLPGLPRERDGLVLVHLSDLHLGSLLGRRWLAERMRQVDSLRPDLLVITGDVLDGDLTAVEPLLPLLRQLHAPLGVWAVTGNHEFYAGLERSVALLKRAGFHVLRDQWEEAAPGLILAGVDDLTARRQFGLPDHPLEGAFKGRPQGATLFLCHSPLQVQRASELGAGLMLSGHTHAGQIWPFGYLVRLSYPYLAGSFRVGGMELVVSRGTGTWGPRMRLFHRSEILRITLRAA
jgi:predicted MPP superfamily phosphohydrolase